MATDYPKEAKAMVRDTVRPRLKAAGFRAHGTRFVRDCPGFVQICEVQASQRNSQASASFTLNLGFFVPDEYRARTRQSPPPRPTVGHGTIPFALRIGDLIAPPDPQLAYDYWYYLGDYRRAQGWNVVSPQDYARFLDEKVAYLPPARGQHIRALHARYYPLDLTAARRVLDGDLVIHVVPFFDRHRTLADLIACPRIDDLSRLVLAVLVDDRARAEALLAKELARANPEYQAILRAIAADHALRLEST